MSEGLLPFIGPVLELATDLNQDSHIYLLEVIDLRELTEIAFFSPKTKLRKKCGDIRKRGSNIFLSFG